MLQPNLKTFQSRPQRVKNCEATVKKLLKFTIKEHNCSNVNLKLKKINIDNYR